MKIITNADENFFPVMHFTPVLTTLFDVDFPDGVLEKLSIEISKETISPKKKYHHFICQGEKLCHKKKSIHLFLAALSLFNRNTQASTLWLRQDSSIDLDAHITVGSISVAAPIQLFLQQSGFQIEPKEFLVHLSDLDFMQSLLLSAKLKRAG